MQVILVMLVSLVLMGCTAMMVGGATAGGYQVDEQERSANRVSEDSAITSEIKGKYAGDSVVSVFNIGVRTYEGTVTLSGTVGSILARDRAGWLARQTDGVRAVNNQIVIEDQNK